MNIRRIGSAEWGHMHVAIFQQPGQCIGLLKASFKQIVSIPEENKMANNVDKNILHSWNSHSMALKWVHNQYVWAMARKPEWLDWRE